MYINKIKLTNFRNYEQQEIALNKNINVIYGDNAQGKTNVLEAIYVGGTTKSHKGSKDSDMIKKEEKEGNIALRSRDGDEGSVELDSFIERIKGEIDNKSLS